MKRMNQSLFLILLLLCGTAAWASGGGEKKEGGPKPPYFELQPSVIANLSKGGKHVRMDIQLLLKKDEYLAQIKPHAPALVNEMLLLVSDEDGAVLNTPKGKEAFRQAALKACNKLMEELMGTEPVKDLFFTAFFVR
jgi:flagellar protein FliL